MCQLVLVPAFLGRVRNDWRSRVFAWQECEGRPLRGAKLQSVHGGAGCIFVTGRPRSVAAHAHPLPAEPCGKRRAQTVLPAFPRSHARVRKPRGARSRIQTCFRRARNVGDRRRRSTPDRIHDTRVGTSRKDHQARVREVNERGLTARAWLAGTRPLRLVPTGAGLQSPGARGPS